MWYYNFNNITERKKPNKQNCGRELKNSASASNSVSANMCEPCVNCRIAIKPGDEYMKCSFCAMSVHFLCTSSVGDLSYKTIKSMQANDAWHFKCGHCRSQNVDLLDVYKRLTKIEEKINLMVPDTSEKKNYASALKGISSAVKKPGVVIKPKQKQGRDEVRKALHEATKGKNYKIVDTINAYNEGVILLCESKAECEKVAEAVNKKIGEKVEAKVPTFKNPKVKILNMRNYDYVIPKSDNDEDFNKFKEDWLKQLKERNEYLANAVCLKFVKIYSKKRQGRVIPDVYDIVMEVDPRSYKRLMEAGHVQSDMEKCRVIDGAIIIRCFKCCDFGHMAKDCKKEEQVCFKCGKNGHQAKNCQENECCFKCKRDGKESNHSVLNTTCPYYIREYKKVTKSVRFTE